MSDITLKEIFEKARNESHSSDEYWNIVETWWARQKKDDISIEEFLELFFEQLAQDRQLISNAFQDYVMAYLVATAKQQKELLKKTNYYLLLPTVFLMHHSLELFLKMIKVDAYNTIHFGNDSKNIIDYITPASVKDLKISNHNIKELFDDEDICLWFSFINNGKEHLKVLKENYIRLADVLNMKNPAEEARFPLRKDSYIYIDRSKIEKSTIKLCSNIIDNLIKTLIASYIEWHTNGKNKLLQQYIKNINKKEELSND